MAQSVGAEATGGGRQCSREAVQSNRGGSRKTGNRYEIVTAIRPGCSI